MEDEKSIIIANATGIPFEVQVDWQKNDVVIRLSISESDRGELRKRYSKTVVRAPKAPDTSYEDANDKAHLERCFRISEE